MATKIEALLIDDITLLDAIVKERTREPNRSFFKKYKPLWKKRYKEYISYSGNPNFIDCSTLLKKYNPRFISLFDSAPYTIGTSIKTPLKEMELTFCPFCSEAGTPNTLDHFLPKEKYPEFSILSKNLVRACDICQGADAKGSKVFNNEGERLFLHPYFDIPEDIEMFKVTIIPPFDKGTNYTIEASDFISGELKQLTQRHLEELKIDTRFRVFFSKEYPRKRNLIIKMLGKKPTKDITTLKDIIQDFYESEKEISINYWDTILYKAFLDNDELLDYLLT